MKTATVGVAALVLVGSAYAAVQMSTDTKDPRDRKASFSCWWSPGARAATVGWRFGSRPPGSEIVSDVTRNAPFARKSVIKVGETMHVTIVFAPGQRLTGPGLSVACVLKAGVNMVPFTDHDHEGVDKTIIAA